MGSVVRLALSFRLLVLAVAVGLLVLGGTSIRDEGVQALPEFSPTYTEIQTEALGLSAEEVEQLITVPLEADLLNGVEGAATIRSESMPGLSSIVMVFQPGTDVYRARQLVEERLTQAHALPNVSKPPTLLQPTSTSRRVLLVGLRSDHLTAIEQSVIARWTVRPRLMGVSGVANIAVWGMRDQQLQVQVDPQQLARKGVTLGQVISSAGNAQVVSPLSFLEASTPGTGGFVETPQQRLQVRHLLEQIADPRALAEVAVEGTNGRLRLGDVSTIVIDHQPLIGDAIVAGGPGLMLVVEKLPDADITEVTRGVEAALDTLRPGLAGMETDTSIFRPADYVAAATANLRLTLAIGALLLLMALIACGFRLRALVIPVVTVPLAVLTAALVMDLLGHDLSAVTIGGLAAATLFVAHDAVATAAQAGRLLPRQPSDPYLVTRALPGMWAGWRRPVLYAGLILLVAVAPIAAMGGRPGAFFTPLAFGYWLGILAGLVVAVTVAPVLAMSLLTRGRPVRRRAGRSWALGRRYLRALNGTTRRPGLVALATAVAGAMSIALLVFLDPSLVPAFEDRDLLVRLEAAAGTAQPRMVATTEQIAEKLDAVPGVANVGAHVGRAVTGDRVTNVSSSEIWVRLDPDADYAETRRAVDDQLTRASGVQASVTTNTADSVRAIGALVDGRNLADAGGLDLLTGQSRPLVVRVYGQEPRTLETLAEQVRAAVAEVQGVVAATAITTPRQPSIAIEVDLAKAQAAGMTPGEVRRGEATLLQGIQVGSVFEQQKVFDVIVQGAPQTRRSLVDVQNLLIDKPGGGQVRLGDVADVRLVDAPSVIRRSAVSRYVDVVAGVDGSAQAVSAAVSDRLRGLSMPLEYHAEVITGATSPEGQPARVAGAAVLAVIAALLLLQAAFRRWRAGLLVLLVLPAALSGGLLAAWLTGGGLSFGALLGLVAVLGFTLRAAVPLVERIQLGEQSQTQARSAALRSAALDAFAPLLTAAVSLVALLVPILVLGPRAGLEVLQPLAVAVLGGLVSAVLVVAFAVPAIYLGFASRAPRDLTADADDTAIYGSEPLMSPWLVAHPRTDRRALGGTPTKQPAGETAR